LVDLLADVGVNVVFLEVEGEYDGLSAEALIVVNGVMADLLRS
jgi:hypothetical protein